jgi:hypothetical protein
MSYGWLAMSDHDVQCPACGGGGGGPFGRRGSAWDVESYTCPRCQGRGIVRDRATVVRPLAKTASRPADGAARKPGIAHTQPPAEQRAKQRSTP